MRLDQTHPAPGTAFASEESKKMKIRHRVSGLVALLLFAAMLVGAAHASASPVWRIDSLSNTTAAPGEILDYRVQITNIGDEAANGEPIVVTITLPSGLTVLDTAEGKDPNSPHKNFGANYGIFSGDSGSFYPCTAGDGSPLVGGESEVKCENTEQLGSNAIHTANPWQMVFLPVKVEASEPGTLVTTSEVHGGGAANSASTVDPVQITAAPPSFGFDAFDGLISDADGSASTQAAAHPSAVVTHIDFNSTFDPSPQVGMLSPVEPEKDIFVDLPAGFVGNPTAPGRCAQAQLANSVNLLPRPSCPPNSQVGVAELRVNAFPAAAVLRPPIFNMIPPPGSPARFGFLAANTVVTLDATVRSNGDYGLTISGRNVSEALGVAGVTTIFWGDPSSPSHDSERACPEVTVPQDGGPTCTVDEEVGPFFRNPTACTPTPNTALPFRAHMDSWLSPGPLTADGDPDLADPRWRSVEYVSHQPPGYPHLPSEQGSAVGITGCEAVPFEPAVAVAPTTAAADSPTGLTVDLTVPQQCWQPGELDSVCESDVRNVEITLPEGMSVNASSAGGLGACAPAEVGLTSSLGASPARFNKAPVSCPDSSKIGKVTIETPLLENDLEGAIYLAKQGENPFGSLLAMYLVAEGEGVVIKQAGLISADPGTGQLTTSFVDAPQTPFSRLHVELFGGPRAALRTPETCGTYSTNAKLTPWSGNAPAQLTSSFEIGSCPNSGFDPKLEAGTLNPLARAFTPFKLRLTRADGSQPLGGLSVSLPQGLLAKLAGIPYCPDATLAGVSSGEGTGAVELANPACPAASQVGSVTVGAGAGPNPFYTETGRAYLAGPYKGAPLSLAVVTPAVAGPFDLGSVVVRNALRIDPETAILTAVSDPLPTIVHGIPLDLRDVRIEINRPDFTLNPTSCDPMSIDASVRSAAGTTVARSNRFQVGGCDRLGFKPGLSLRLKGGTKRSAHPSLRAVLRMPQGGANIAQTSVVLPRTEFLDQAHIGTICTRVQYVADACPARSVYGYARAVSPLLGEPLQGPVYLRSNGGDRELPDLVASLDGQIHIDVVGYVDAVRGRLRTRFLHVPDAPVSRFVLTMKGGKKGLIENSDGVCSKRQMAAVRFEAQNGVVRHVRSPVRSSCRKHAHPKRHKQHKR
jgi:uncharacterized repeat protein (TIGR01451 family)